MDDSEDFLSAEATADSSDPWSCSSGTSVDHSGMSNEHQSASTEQDTMTLQDGINGTSNQKDCWEDNARIVGTGVESNNCEPCLESDFPQSDPWKVQSPCESNESFSDSQNNDVVQENEFDSMPFSPDPGGHWGNQNEHYGLDVDSIGPLSFIELDESCLDPHQQETLPYISDVEELVPGNLRRFTRNGSLRMSLRSNPNTGDHPRSQNNAHETSESTRDGSEIGTTSGEDSYNLLQMINSLAANLPPSEDLSSGCQVNLAFEDTETDPRYIDISSTDCDMMPWYFDGPQDNVPGNAGKRPHSIAVPNGLAFLLRGDPLRCSLPLDRPVSLPAQQAPVDLVVPEGRQGCDVPDVVPSAPTHEDIPEDVPTVDSEEEIDWSWVAGEARRLRASMRRLQPLDSPSPLRQDRVRSAPAGSRGQSRGSQTGDGVLPTLAAPPTLEATSQRPRSAGARFPRHYSSRPSSASAASAASDATTADSTLDTPDSPLPEQPERTCPGDENQSPIGQWPHNLSSMLATLGCTLGLFNMSRFAILSVHFGANFFLQFMFLSIILGIPLYTFHASIGQFLSAGVMDMWKISPVFQGIGIALLASQALIGIYSIVGISWMFIYFRDSFITKQDRYRWAEPFDIYRKATHPTDGTIIANGTWRLEETVPDYLNGVVLQRHNLQTPESEFGHLKFQVTFNLAVVWMIVFVSLSKGLKSYGKVVFVFSLFPVFGMLILCTKLLGLSPRVSTEGIFPETVWSEFFLNSKSWIAAVTEVFFTWSLLGASMMQIASHNRHKHFLKRDVLLVVIFTLTVLSLTAFLANTWVHFLSDKSYTYVPSSFEFMSTYTFLRPHDLPPTTIFAKTPVRHMSHSSFVLGNRVLLPPGTVSEGSGYQVLRFATELAPATFALLGAEEVSPFWAVLFYFVMILFGIAQQLAIWHCVITGITAINASLLKSWETTITFFSCACGFILGLPMTTERGIYVVYFLDYAIGSAWWIMILYLFEIGAVFVVRGRPYSGENIVQTLMRLGIGCLQAWAAPMLVFTWNVILPVALLIMCIAVFKTGRIRELYNWNNNGNEYWPLWTREVGCLLQLLPLISVFLVAIIQTCRYLSDGPVDLFDRIQLLCRPPRDSQQNQESGITISSTGNNNSTPSAPSLEPAFEDPPPKYTPPPSYTTATGARIAKLLRQSFRRSMRRITSALGEHSENSAPAEPPPPDYAAVLVEINQALRQNNEQDVCIAVDGPHSSDDVPTFQRGLSPYHLTSDARMSTLTASEVATILRGSMRRTLRQSGTRREVGKDETTSVI